MTKLMVVCALIASFFVLPGVCQARKEILDLNFPESPSIQGQMMNISKPDNVKSARLSVPGYPDVPMISKTFTYPSGSIISEMQIVSLSTSKMKLRQSLPIVPERPTVSDRKLIAARSQFTMNSVYPQNWYSFDIRHGLDPDTLEPEVYASVRIYPARVQGLDVEYLNSIKLSFDIQEAQINRTHNNRSDAGLMIVAPQNFLDEIAAFITHKTTLGISVFTRSVEDIEASVTGRDTAEKIKHALEQAFTDSHVRNVILLGDVSFIPVRYTFHSELGGSEDWMNTPSDLYYADLYDRNGHFCDWDANGNSVFGEYQGENTDECDFMPDLLVGRIPAANLAEVNAAMNKIMHYEATVSGSEDWQNKVVLIGADTFTASGHNEYSGIPEGEATKELIAGESLSSYQLTKLYETDRYAKTGTCSTQTVTNAFEAGARYINYANHGSVTSWAFPGGLDTSDVSAMSNLDKLPIVFGYACLTGAFDTENSENPFGGSFRSFSEALLLNPNGGAVSYFAATRTAFAGGYGMGGHTACMGYLDRAFFKGVSQNQSNQGKLYLITVSDFLCNLGLQAANDFVTILEFIYFGDPTLNAGGISQTPDFSMVSMGIDDTDAGDSDGCAEPGETVELNLVLRNDGSAATNVTVTLDSMDSGLLLTANEWTFPDFPGKSQYILDPVCSVQIESGTQNDRIIILSASIAGSEGSWDVTVPFFIGESPLIQADQLVVTQDVNNDAIASPGETIRFSPVMMNAGCGVADNMTAQITINDQYIQDYGAYANQNNPDIGPGESRYSDKMFYATIDPMSPHDHSVNCHITLTHPGSGSFWVFDMPLVIKDFIKPIVDEFTVIPEQPSPGEPVTVTVRAIDGSGVAEVRATLWSHDTGSSMTVQLFDDGLHNDGVSGDSNFGNEITLPEARTFFIADIYSRDQNGIDGYDYRKGSVATVPFIPNNNVLVVGGADMDLYLGFFTQALEDAGYAYDVWSNYRGIPANSIMDHYINGAVIWFFSHTFPMLEEKERDAIDYYMEQGGNLLITEQDIGWYMVESGNPETEQWYRNRLLAEYITDAVTEKTIEGVTGDPFSNGMEFSIEGGSGAQNQQWPSLIEPVSPAVSCLKYKDFSGEGSGTSAVRADRDGAKHIYLAFGFEGISTQSARKELMDHAMTWFGVSKSFGICPWNQSPGWWIGPELPASGMYAAAAYCNSTHRIYRTDGITDQSTPFGGSIYQIDTLLHHSGDTGADLLIPSIYHATACLQDGTSEKVYFFGGINLQNSYMEEVQVFDPADLSVTILDSDPIPDDMLGCPVTWAVSDNKFYLISAGLFSAPFQISKTWRFDPTAPSGSKWENLHTELAVNRMFSATAAIDGKIYVIGGFAQIDDQTGYAYSKVEVLDTYQEAPVWDDAAVADLPEPAAWISAAGIPRGSNVEMEGRIIVGGSYFYQMETGFIFDPLTGIWNEYWPTHVPRWLSSQLLYVPSSRGPELWIAGGFDQIVYGYSEILHLNPEPEAPWISVRCTPDTAPAGSNFTLELDIAGDRSGTAVDCYICMEIGGAFYFMTMNPVFPSFTSSPVPLFSQVPLTLEIMYSGPLMVIPIPDGLPEISGTFYAATLKSNTGELAGGFSWSSFTLGDN